MRPVGEARPPHHRRQRHERRGPELSGASVPAGRRVPTVPSGRSARAMPSGVRTVATGGSRRPSGSRPRSAREVHEGPRRGRRPARPTGAGSEFAVRQARRAEGAARGEQQGAELGAPARLDRQRIDKWLWHARVVRTRQAAAALAASGHVRRQRPAHRCGEPAGQAGRRRDGGARSHRAGSQGGRALPSAGAPRTMRAPCARTSCPDASTAGRNSAPPPAVRERGTGRPTKRERRAIDRFTDDREA